MRLSGPITRELLAPQYAKETTDLLRAMNAPPSGARVVLIDRLIRSLKATDIWRQFDIMYVLAAHDAQAARLNWKNPGPTEGTPHFFATAVNSPTFTTDRGYAGNGTTSYLNTNFQPNTHAVALSRDSATQGVYINGGTDTDSSTPYVFGNQGTFRMTAWTSGGFRNRTNDGTSGNTGTGVSTRYGLSMMSRNISTTREGFRNGASIGTEAVTSTSLATTVLWIGASSAAGSGYSDNRIAFACAGGALTAVQHAALYSALQEYLVGVGAQ